MTFPSQVAPGELIESAWGNSVVAHLPANLGVVQAISFGNVPADGVERTIGSGFAVAAPVAGRVNVIWSFNYAGSAAAGRLNPIIRHGGAVAGSANQSFASGDYGTSMVLGSYTVAVGGDCTIQFNVALTGVGSNLNVDGYAVAFLVPNL